ncbi:MAG TPA: inositol-3-phosphate synthase [Eoetvoesiella sp.]
MDTIKIAIVGLGNCASSLIQGIHYYADKSPEDAIGLMHWSIGGYTPGNIRTVAAFDIDARKVGHDIHDAIFAPPNCTTVFNGDIKPGGVKVSMGCILDGYSEDMNSYPDALTFIKSDAPQPDQNEVVRILKSTGAEVMLNYLPVGSEKATRFYAECALAAGVAFVNCIPVFIASDPEWAERFAQKGIPLIGDDIKAQLGATITHRVLTDLFARRGVKLERTYQLNTGGNTDFLNMQTAHRLESKRLSKTEAVQSVAATRLDDLDIHVGPSDYVAWQKDNKICFIRMEGKLFGDVPMNLELRLSVEDSPNSAGVAIDMIRCAKLAMLRGEGGVLDGASAYFCKHPPQQMTDDKAYDAVERFITRTLGKKKAA